MRVLGDARLSRGCRGGAIHPKKASMEITEQEFQRLLQTGEYPIATDRTTPDGVRVQRYTAPKPTNAGTIWVQTYPDGRRHLSGMTKSDLQALVVDYAYAYGIDPAIAVAQIQRESGFNPNAVGRDGERGLAQILPSTWPQATYGAIPWEQAFDPESNLTAWGNYMQWLLDRYGWDYQKALQAYNGGPGNQDRGTASSAAQNYARTILANAGQGSVDYSQTADSPDDSFSISGLSLFSIAAIALVAILVIKQ
jgi:hypothetical protein